MTVSTLKLTSLAGAAALALTATPALAHDCGSGKKVTTASASTAPAKDLVQTAVAAGSFTTLAKALDAAGLVGTLQGKGPFTVFAPTDAAFAKLPAGALEALLADREKLRSVLLYHVVPGQVTAKDVVKLDAAKTVQGEAVEIAAAYGRVTVDGANVVKTDVLASNGVIHVIDSVLLPNG